eukprot:gene2387-2747_t
MGEEAEGDGPSSSEEDCFIVNVKEPSPKKKKYIDNSISTPLDLKSEDSELQNDCSRASSSTSAGPRLRPDRGREPTVGDSAVFKIKKIAGDGHCIAHCFAEKFCEPLPTVLGKLENEIMGNIALYSKFSDVTEDNLLAELSEYTNQRVYCSGTVDLILEAFANVYKCRLFIYSDINEEPIGIIGEKYPNEILLRRAHSHFDLIEVFYEETLEKTDDSKFRQRFGSFTFENPTAEQLLYVLLLNPEQYEERYPVKGVRRDYMYTIKNYSVDDITSDDNGAYINSNKVTSHYYVQINEKKDNARAFKVHKSSKGFYYKQRNGRAYENVLVCESDVYSIECYYRQNKSIPSLRRMIVRIKANSKQNYEDFMCVVYSCTKQLLDEDDDIQILPHGNCKAGNNMQRSYYKTATSTLQAEDILLMNGKNPFEAYDHVLENSGGPLKSLSQSQEPRDMKQIYNRKSQLKKKKESGDQRVSAASDEMLQIIHEQKTCDFIQTIVATRSAYFFFVYSPKQIDDIKQFCCDEVEAVSVLGVDTTFNLCDLWVTDTCYRNKRIVHSSSGKHPVFLGPAMFHFTKGPDSFSRLALELIAADPGLRNLKKVGVDMEEAIFSGFKHHIPDLKRLLCVRHLSSRDEEKLLKLLQVLKINQAQRNHAKSEIIKDIYGERKGNVYEYGLADSFDNEDFNVKLGSLEEKWGKLCPGFHEWFVRKRKAKLIESVIQSARTGTDTVGLYYQNDIESLHFVEKHNQSFGKLSTLEVISYMKKMHDRQDSDEIRAIYGAGRYVLSTEYKKFSVDSALWHSWSTKRKEDHIKAFRDYRIGPSDSFHKPRNAGRKPGYNTRRRNHDEPDIVIDRNAEKESPHESLTIHLSKSPTSQQWRQKQADNMQKSDSSPGNLRFADPRVDQPKEFELNLRSTLPQSVSKCQGNCGKKISSDDSIVVKSYGTSTWTDRKTGKEQSKFGPMYIHFKDTCLKKFDSENFYGANESFDYSKIKVNSGTLRLLRNAEKDFLKSLGVGL